MEYYLHNFNHTKIILVFIMKPDYFFPNKNNMDE